MIHVGRRRRRHGAIRPPAPARRARRAANSEIDIVERHARRRLEREAGAPADLSAAGGSHHTTGSTSVDPGVERRHRGRGLPRGHEARFERVGAGGADAAIGGPAVPGRRCRSGRHRHPVRERPNRDAAGVLDRDCQRSGFPCRDRCRQLVFLPISVRAECARCRLERHRRTVERLRNAGSER